MAWKQRLELLYLCLEDWPFELDRRTANVQLCLKGSFIHWTISTARCFCAAFLPLPGASCLKGAYSSPAKGERGLELGTFGIFDIFQ